MPEFAEDIRLLCGVVGSLCWTPRPDGLYGMTDEEVDALRAAWLRLTNELKLNADD